MKQVTISFHETQKDSHYDVFLETEDFLELKTYEFSVDDWNKLQTGQSIFCAIKASHRRMYLDFEGTISGGRGNVKIVWRGVYNEKNSILKEKIRINLENLTLIIK